MGGSFTFYRFLASSIPWNGASELHGMSKIEIDANGNIDYVGGCEHTKVDNFFIKDNQISIEVTLENPEVEELKWTSVYCHSESENAEAESSEKLMEVHVDGPGPNDCYDWCDAPGPDDFYDGGDYSGDGDAPGPDDCYDCGDDSGDGDAPEESELSPELLD